MTIDQAIETSTQLVANGQMSDAERVLLQVLAVEPRNAMAMHVLGIVCGRSGRYDRAVELLQRTVAINPGDHAAWYHLGLALGQSGRQTLALEAYGRAIACKPDYAEGHTNHAITLLLLGDLSNGLAEYQWRHGSQFATPGPTFSQPHWDGRDLNDKTILLYSEQGLGDTIQFLRYVPMVRDRGGRVLLLIQPPLRSLISNFAGVEAVVDSTRPLPPFDVHSSLLTLPLLFQTTLETIPREIPYLQATREKIELWRDRLGPRDGRVRVGIVWAGSPVNTNDANRSISAARMSVLDAVQGVEFYSLQTGPSSAQRAEGPPGMIDHTALLTDFSETAALVANLDLVISVDTAVVHLCGAIGKPVWVLVAKMPDWRWLLDRSDSPWYPSVTLFRQRFPGDWDGVLKAVVDRLKIEAGNVNVT